MAWAARPQLWAWLAISAAIAVLVWLLSPILAPFLFGAILAYILNPLVERLTRRGVPRTLAAVLVLLLALALLVGILFIVLPLFVKETRLLMDRLPGFLDWLEQHAAPWLRERLDIEVPLDMPTLKQMARDAFADHDDLARNLVRSVGVGGLAVAGFFANLVLVPVVLFYMLRDWNGLLASLDALLPRRSRDKIVQMAREADRVLAEWLRGQLLVILIMGAFYVAGLWLAGLQFALPIGVITGLAVVVPYVGIAIGFVLATITALLQFDSLTGALWVWLVLVGGQMLEGMVVTPLIVGERIGLHPVAVLFALLAFGQLFGFFGVLLALPASAVLLVALRHLRGAYVASPLYGR